MEEGTQDYRKKVGTNGWLWRWKNKEEKDEGMGRGGRIEEWRRKAG